jgi:type IV pilus assembly protein PilM
VLFRRAKSLVGLDIGSSSVKAIELNPAGKGFRVSAIGVESVPPDSIVDGAIIDGGAVGRCGPPPVCEQEVQGEGRRGVAVR